MLDFIKRRFYLFAGAVIIFLGVILGTSALSHKKSVEASGQQTYSTLSDHHVKKSNQSKQTHLKKRPIPDIPVPKGANNPLGFLPDKVEKKGLTHYKNVYGGLIVTNDQTHIVVYLTKLDPKIEDALIGSAPPKDFTFLKTPHSISQQNATHKEVIRDSKALVARGIDLVQWGPNFRTGKEIIKVKDLTPRKRAYLMKKYGADNIIVKKAKPSDIAFLW